MAAAAAGNVDTTDVDSLKETYRLLNEQAIDNEDSFYTDPITGFMVTSSYGHWKRGTGCCGSNCRHCPWKLDEDLESGKIIIKDIEET